MNKWFVIALAICLILVTFSVAVQPVSACGKHKKSRDNDQVNKHIITKDYGSVELSGGIETGHFNDVWNLTRGGLKISFSYDARDLVDDGFDQSVWLGTFAIGQFGLRDTSASDYAPMGKGIWLNAMYDPEADTFDPKKMIDTDWDEIPDTIADSYFDPDDQLMLQRGGPYWSEQDYDLPGGVVNPLASYAVWFDRDGVNSAQKNWWGFVDGAIYNTSGLYDIELTLRATSISTGEAYMTINGVHQGFWSNGWRNETPYIYPAGMTFKGDMKNMQVFYSLMGVGAIQNISFSDIKVVQTFEYDLNIDIVVEIIDSVINSSVTKNIPENIRIYSKLKVKPKVKCNGDIYLDMDVVIDINEQAKVDVVINLQIDLSCANDDASAYIDVYIKDAGDVAIDSAITVNEIKDDAIVDFSTRIQNSGEVRIHQETEVSAIGDDALVTTKMTVLNSLNVWLDIDNRIFNVSDDAKVSLIIIMKNLKNINLNINIQVSDISDDSKIWFKLYIKNCGEVTREISVAAYYIGDQSKIVSRIRIT